MPDQPTERTDHQYLVHLRQLLVDRFSDDELRTLCFDLRLNYDTLPAVGTHGKACEVILALGKQSRLPELVAYVRKVRPNLAVDDLPISITADALAALSAESAGFGVTQTASGSYIAQAASGGTATVTVIYQGAQVSIPSSEAVRRHRAALAQKPEYRCWADEFYIEEEGKILPLLATPYDVIAGQQRQDLLQAIRAHERLLILGEPGIGKTVAVQRMMWEIAQAQDTRIPVFVPLLSFQGDLIEELRVALSETGELCLEGAPGDPLKTTRAFLRQTPCQIMFDGLNETPGRYRDQVWLAIERVMREFPQHRYLVTSRSQDELWRKLRASGAIQDAVVVQPIADEQVQRYLMAHLGDEAGLALHSRLDDSLKALARTPLLLWLIKEASQTSKELPRNRGELFENFVVNRMLERDMRLNPQVEMEVKKDALACLAFQLQQARQLACERDEAIRVLAEVKSAHDAETILNEAIVHGLLLQVKKQVRFMHQSVQEYFSALTLKQMALAERQAPGWQRAGQWLARRNLAARARDDWWMETFVQLAGLLDDADWLAREVAQVNPWLAWWCVQEGRGVQEATRQAIADRSVRLLESKRVTDRRRAVQALARIKSERVMRPLLRAAADDDPEVARLAAQAFMEMGEAARTLVMEALRGQDRRLRSDAVRCLIVRPDDALCRQIAWENILGQPMVWVPPGPFLMGSDKSRDPQAYDDELPQHTITLPGYWIGRYPVTVAQFRAFINASGHKPADPESLKGTDDRPVMNVTWNDAMAYCRWLGERTGLLVTLPSEAEWEKAARGTDGRIYPWGNVFDANKCNTYESNIGRTTPVGKYSLGGDSPYGCADMAGNVWEWTRSLFKPYPYRVEDGRENLSSSGSRVVRGGSFYFNEWLARASSRNHDSPSSYYWDRGFRVGVSAPFSPTSAL